MNYNFTRRTLLCYVFCAALGVKKRRVIALVSVFIDILCAAWGKSETKRHVECCSGFKLSPRLLADGAADIVKLDVTSLHLRGSEHTRISIEYVTKNIYVVGLTHHHPALLSNLIAFRH
jgi:hypothetical protein